MIKVAQIGVGYWGPNLLRNLVSSSEFEVVAVADPSAGRQAFVQSLYPTVSVTANYQDILADSNADAVVIATPVATHFDMAMETLSAGKHVLVEKPMARTVGEVETIGDLAKEKSLTAMVGHTFLFNSAVRYLKELIDSGELGEVRYIYSQRLNLGRIRSDVDALWNLAPHDVSIIQYLLDDSEPSEVHQHGMGYVQPGINDVSFLDIIYPSGVMAHVHVSWLDPHKVRRMTVVGSKKMVVYDDIAENKICIYDKGIEPKAVLGEQMDYDKPPFEFSHRSGNVLMPKIDWKEPLAVELEHFAACILGDTTCLTDAEHARKVVSILSKKL